jgi:hypothetical protein
MPLAAICHPSLNEFQVRGYFNVLADLPAEAIYAAATELAASRVYPTWPMPGEIRAVAAKIMMPQITPAEAWKLAQRAIAMMGDDSRDYKNGVPMHEWNEKILAELPGPVATTLRCLFKTIGPSTTAYAQFRDEYQRQVEIVKRPLMLPAPLKAMMGGLLAAMNKDPMPRAAIAECEAQAEAKWAPRLVSKVAS